MKMYKFAWKQDEFQEIHFLYKYKETVGQY